MPWTIFSRKNAIVCKLCVKVQGGAPNSMLEGGTKKNIKDMHLLSLKESQELLYDPFTFVLLAQT